MKRLILFLCTFALLVLSTGCIAQSRQDEVLDSLGIYDSKQFWSNGEFQDYTDFGIYTYSFIDLENSQYFAPISAEDIDTICSYIDNFEQFVDLHRESDPNDELVINYAFDRSIIDSADCFYIYSRYETNPFTNYDVWLLDIQTNNLYYFHNNI